MLKIVFLNLGTFFYLTPNVVIMEKWSGGRLWYCV